MRAAVALLLGACSLAQAQERQGCSDAVEQALRATRPATVALGQLISQHCKPWPVAADGLSAAVMAFKSKPQPPEGSDAWDVVVALLDARTLRPHHLRWTHVDSDALTGIDNSSFKLDTAPWQLTANLRALGLRFHSSAYGSRYAEAFWSDELTLFVPDGHSLRAVLGVVTQARALTGHAPDDWQVAKLFLAMGQRDTSGWADIVVTNTEKPVSQPPQRLTYRYNGTAYDLRSRPAPFWSGYCCALAW